jgi:hypothetical protein
VLSDAADDPWFGDEPDYAHLFTAAGTGERIDFEDAAQRLGPAPASLS